MHCIDGSPFVGILIFSLPPGNAPPEKARSGHGDQRKRATYVVTISYFGPAFSGWAWAPGLDGTAQGMLQDALAAYVPVEEGKQASVVDSKVQCTHLMRSDGVMVTLLATIAILR